MPRFVFVVTYGRSGSTLTQGLLNAMPGALVRGEHDFYILHLYRAWSGVRKFQREYVKGVKAAGAKSAFYGLDEIRPDDFVDSAHQLVLSQLWGSKEQDDIELLGFKEVLWHRIRPKETAEFFRFFERIFPDALYVLHRRDHQQVAGSGFWRRESVDKVAQSLRRVEEIQDFLRRTRPDRTLDTRYEHYTSPDPDVVEAELRKLAVFATGGCDDELLTKLKETLAIGHGPHPFRKKVTRVLPPRPTVQPRPEPSRRPRHALERVRAAAVTGARRLRRGLGRMRASLRRRRASVGK